MTDLVVWPILDELLGCLESAFHDWDHPSPPALICHRTGNGQSIPMFDPKRKINECCGGLAWVRLMTNYPTAGGEGLEFSQRVSNCFDGEAVTVELGALRCWPHAGSYASCNDWADNAYNVAEDLAALRRAIKCCWTPAHEMDGLAALRGQSRPAGISGQCVGNILPVTIGQVDASLDCCEPTSPGSP
jgi:hypothetical protein